VDDNKRVAELLGQTVARRGFNPIVFNNAPEAYECIGQWQRPPIGAILDVFLQNGVTGIDIACVLERLFSGFTAIAFVTGYDVGQLDKHISGAVVLQKPIERGVLDNFLSLLAIRACGLPPILEDAACDMIRVHQLLPAEARILACLATGTTRAGLAKQLRIGENTLKFQIRTLLQRTSTTSTEEVLAMLLKLAAERCDFIDSSQ
jgi:FixJ family two-component response regulator